ncbi:reverse transcriptase-like protein [Sphingomonas sp. QA11]|nr:reverse transcriptase-like protein [Sphingomonas sp. QA11]WCM27168.1 reverse transcriptase-like protein [Sphingomonas sp. QA11]
MTSRVKIFFDGGCRPAPQGMEIAVVIGGKAHIQRDLGPGTGMDAEWLALIHAVGLARKLGLTYVVFIGDSVAVVNQANGTAKCRGGNIQHLEEFRAITSAANPPRIRHIKRSQNLAGIALARLHAR